jgi:uncharacterized membrane protein YfcA
VKAKVPRGGSFDRARQFPPYLEPLVLYTFRSQENSFVAPPIASSGKMIFFRASEEILVYLGYILVGLGVGMLAGFMGIGGGLLLVPTWVCILGLWEVTSPWLK